MNEEIKFLKEKTEKAYEKFIQRVEKYNQESAQLYMLQESSNEVQNAIEDLLIEIEKLPIREW